MLSRKDFLRSIGAAMFSGLLITSYSESSTEKDDHLHELTSEDFFKEADCEAGEGALIKYFYVEAARGEIENRLNQKFEENKECLHGAKIVKVKAFYKNQEVFLDEHIGIIQINLFDKYSADDAGVAFEGCVKEGLSCDFCAFVSVFYSPNLLNQEQIGV